MCEKGANSEHEHGVECGFVAAIARELRMMVASKIYRCNSYSCDTAGVILGCQQVFDAISGWILLTLDEKCGPYDTDFAGNNQYTPKVQVTGQWTNMLASKTETSLESICSASLGQKRERFGRVDRTHSNENPKRCPNVSRNGYPSFKGLRTPRFPSRPDIFDLQNAWSQQGAQDAE